MKDLKRALLLLTSISFYLIVPAQENTLPVREPDYNKPFLFEQLPQRILCSTDELQSLLQAQQGQAVNTDLALHFNFRGTVVSVADKYAGDLVSVTIRSSNYAGAVLNLARVRLSDGSIKFTGRIISLQHGDAFDLVQENNQYYFIKKGFYDLINE
ncbi:MAG: hypothetical protein GC171_05215 [Terrimonas sp.]|nr:hypothetical protein [Terrimonas sp.]